MNSDRVRCLGSINSAPSVIERKARTQPPFPSSRFRFAISKISNACGGSSLCLPGLRDAFIATAKLSLGAVFRFILQSSSQFVIARCHAKVAQKAGFTSRGLLLPPARRLSFRAMSLPGPAMAENCFSRTRVDSKPADQPSLGQFPPLALSNLQYRAEH